VHNFRKPENSAGHEPNCQDPAPAAACAARAFRFSPKGGEAPEPRWDGMAPHVAHRCGSAWSPQSGPVPFHTSTHTEVRQPCSPRWGAGARARLSALACLGLARSSRVFQPLAGPENRRGCLRSCNTATNPVDDPSTAGHLEPPHCHSFRDTPSLPHCDTRAALLMK
jgi:hypothetical protein